ncbi:MAG: UpxY family transcription antiterminator [Deltaproteobacteria bacterium]|nr:UpxY family transcription antiterminator [Deltaproteobacteria bacterium]
MSGTNRDQDDAIPALPDKDPGSTAGEGFPEGARWYALHTRSRFEQKVYNGLRGKSFEAFLPKAQVMSRRKDRRKKILVPILPGYVFVQAELEPYRYWEIIKTVGVVRMVAFKGKPVPASDQEIDSLMILNGTDRTVENQSFMQKGDRVMIMEGPLKGLVGFYLKHKNRSEKVVVSIELLQRSMAVEIEGWALEKIS